MQYIFFLLNDGARQYNHLLFCKPTHSLVPCVLVRMSVQRLENIFWLIQFPYLFVLHYRTFESAICSSLFSWGALVRREGLGQSPWIAWYPQLRLHVYTMNDTPTDNPQSVPDQTTSTTVLDQTTPAPTNPAIIVDIDEVRRKYNSFRIPWIRRQ